MYPWPSLDSADLVGVFLPTTQMFALALVYADTMVSVRVGHGCLFTLISAQQCRHEVQCLSPATMSESGLTVADFNSCAAFSHFRGPVNMCPVMVTHGFKEPDDSTNTITSLQLEVYFRLQRHREARHLQHDEEIQRG